jgi:hypothetical protein
MTDSLESALCALFAARGISNAADVAHEAMKRASVAVRDAEIFALWGCLTEAEIATRKRLTERRVRQIIHEQKALRKMVA